MCLMTHGAPVSPTHGGVKGDTVSIKETPSQETPRALSIEMI